MNTTTQDVFSRAPQIGCGLVRIGRKWGVKEMEIPSEPDARNFLRKAFELGIRVFDTAPAYGTSEERLGKFLSGLDVESRRECFIATKCGEEYDFESHTTRVDHSPDNLEKSIERSLARLPHISLLQLHKATPALMRDGSILRLLARYKGGNIPYMGVCVTDSEAAKEAIASNFFDFIQFPYNVEHPEMRQVFSLAHNAGRRVLISRPFASGELFSKTDEKQSARDSLKFILKDMKWGGAILVGTNNAEHLEENLKIFNELKSL